MSLTRRIAHLERRTRPQRQAEHDGARETLAAKLANLHERLLLAGPGGRASRADRRSSGGGVGLVGGAREHSHG